MMSNSIECCVLTPHGKSIKTLFSALQQKKTAATTLPHCLSPGTRHGSLVPIQMGIAPTLPETNKPIERILGLLKGTLIPLLEEALINKTSVPSLMLIVLPAKNSVRYNTEHQDVIQNFVKDQWNTTIHFLHEDDDLITSFLEAQHQLQQGIFERLIFGGVDSFLNLKAIRAFETNVPIRKTGNPDAPLLGEGAAFFCLSKKTELLFKAVHADQNLSAMPHSPYWVTNRSVGRQAEFSWHESMRDYPLYRDLTELHLQKWIGHLGAAQFPLQMVLGFYWASINTKTHHPIVLYNENFKRNLILQPFHYFRQ